MKKQVTYYPVMFSADTVRAAEEAFLSVAKAAQLDPKGNWSVTIGRETWTSDFAEEFYSDYRRGPVAAFMTHWDDQYKLTFQIVQSTTTVVTVEAPSRREIESVFAVFGAAEEGATVPEPDRRRPKLFIGHGRNAAWRDLKDHLQDQHGYEIVAYETGARAGHTIRDILEEMLEDSSLAILVLTGEDETSDGSMRARQNVIHEIGLFQGRLGFPRAIVLVEAGIQEFSNIAGIHQIRFASGGIRETFGDVLATIRREFG